jgi:diguanylate cyclase (GGDEF)-like protein/PAS domain S-box-containing protein
VPKPRILIIDDIPANVGVIVDILETEGYRVLVATDGTEGVRRAETERPDLILLDVMMPGVDGFAVCRRLKSSAQTNHIPVIFMTALDDLQDKLAGFAAGAVDYLAKPLQIAEVVTRARTHLELGALRRQLAAQNQELRAARDELEQRVQSRTAALRAEVEERRRAEHELQKSFEQIHDLYNHAPCGYHSLDDNGIFQRINDTQLSWLGHEREELVGKRRLVEFLTPKSARLFSKAFTLIKRQGWVRDVELQLVRRDGSRVPVLLSATAVRDAEDRFVMTRTTLYDLSERKQTEELIRHMAHHDPLTGLWNRTLFQEHLAEVIGRARGRHESVATMFLDLDQFNQINDSYGHFVGDQVLCEISKRLSACLGGNHSLARWGGDEFVVAVTSLDVRNTTRLLAETMLEALRQPIVAEKHELHLNGSIGISVYPTDGQDVHTLTRAADTAMYHAKEKGRGTLEFFTPALTSKVQHRMALAAKLRRALERNELYLHYQPQVDIDGGRIIGTEALLRWQCPELGLIPPNEFIPIAEEMGLIQSIGEWVLRRACEQLKRWQDEGHGNLKMAVNLSVRQLSDPKLQQSVARVLHETGCPPTALELEITENLLMQPSDDNLRVLHSFNAMGIELTIDDFGVGYSSLSYLQSFPIQALKIDRTFVNHIGQAPHHDEIVGAIIAMAQSLHLRVLAEGVETMEQIAFLRARGCRAAQGYYYSRPVTAERVSELLDSQCGCGIADPLDAQQS